MKNTYSFFILKGISVDKNTLHNQLFMDMLLLRITGYRKYYGNKLMPIDLYDNFCDHLVLCKMIDGRTTPVGCIRSIAYLDCLHNEVEFLPISRTQTSNIVVTNQIKLLIHKYNNNINYDSGLTISPHIESQKEMYTILKIIIGLCLKFHQHQKNKIFLISSIKKTKTDSIFNKIGFQKLCEDNQYQLKGLENEEFRMLKYNFTDKLINQWTNDSLSLWNSRKTLTCCK